MLARFASLGRTSSSFSLSQSGIVGSSIPHDCSGDSSRCQLFSLPSKNLCLLHLCLTTASLSSRYLFQWWLRFRGPTHSRVV